MYQLDTSDAILLYYLFCAKIVPALITYFADKLFNIKINFKSLSVLNASIENVNIKWAGYEIVIGEIGLRSKYINKEYKKPLCIDFDDVKINQIYDETNAFEGSLHEQKQHEAKNHEVVAERNDNGKHNSNANEKNKNAENSKWAQDFQSKLIALLAMYLPPTVMMTLQLFQIRIKKFSTTLLNRDKGPMISISIPDLDLYFNGYLTKHNRVLKMALILQHIKSQFIAYNKENPTCKPRDACLAEIVIDVKLEWEWLWQNKLLVFESHSVSLCNTQVMFYGGIFDIIEHIMRHTKGEFSFTLNANSHNKSDLDLTDNEEKRRKQLAAITPNVFTFNAEQIEAKSLDKFNSFHWHLLLQSVTMKTLVKQQDTKAKVYNLRIYTPVQEVFYLKELTLDAVQADKNVKTIIIIDTADVVYCHEDIYGWYLKIITAGMKSNRTELILRGIEIANQKMIEFYHSEFIQNVFKEIILEEIIELNHVTVLFELDDQISTMSIKKFSVLLSQSKDQLRESFYTDYGMNLLFRNRHWVVDYISDGPICWYMGSKNPHINNEDTKSPHVRGRALYLGNFIYRVSSNRLENGIKLNFRASKLHVEYSNKFTKFVEQSAKSYRSYVNLFSQLKKKEIHDDNENNSLENVDESLKKLSVSFEIKNFSSSIINRHNVCIYTSISCFSSDCGFSYLFDMFQVSTIDYRKYNELCDMSDLTTTFVSSSLLKVSLEQSEKLQLVVDFAEKLECTWNAHFIRHLLSIFRDFHRFKGDIANALELEKISKEFKNVQAVSVAPPPQIPLGLDIKKLRNISFRHADVNMDKLMLLLNEVSGQNLFFYNYFN